MSFRDVKSSLVHPKEKVYFVISVIFSIIVYLYLIFFVVVIAMPNVISSLIMLIVIFGSLKVVQVGAVRLNGVRLSDRQFPEIYERVRHLCERMDMYKIPDVYVIQSGGTLNAFAARFFGKNMVTVYSDIFEVVRTGEPELLDFVLAHELAHIRRKHVSHNLLILPARVMPLLGTAYSRACEFTCDRFATYVTANPIWAERGLTMLAVGRDLYPVINVDEYLLDSAQNRGFFHWLAEKLSTHPALPRRIAEVRRMAASYRLPSPAADETRPQPASNI